jgi:hypothetical protein
MIKMYYWPAMPGMMSLIYRLTYLARVLKNQIANLLTRYHQLGNNEGGITGHQCQ